MSTWKGNMKMETIASLEETFEEEETEEEENEEETEEEKRKEDATEAQNVTRSFFIVWESNCRNFIEDDLKFSCPKAQGNLKIHVFARKDTPKDASPPGKPWLKSHYSRTTCPYASDSGLIAWLVQNIASPQAKTDGQVLYLVSERARKYEELLAILKASNANFQFEEVNGEEKTILDYLPNVCHWCKMVFLNQTEQERHFEKMHDFFCDNLKCEVKRFRSEEELQQHLQKKKRCKLCLDATFCSETQLLKHVHEKHQRNDFARTEITANKDTELLCQFCPQKVFSCVEQRDIHMKNCHKKCNCSCGQYFKSRDEYLEHFYGIYPLACFENRKCPQRFQDVRFQARHHKQDHFSIQPFYCIPCNEIAAEDGRKEKICFKDEKSLRIHCAAMGHEEREMFLPENGKVDVRSTLQRRVPSRTCSAINYC